MIIVKRMICGKAGAFGVNDEIKQAFAHPLERARATAQDVPLDRISLRDHIVSVEIGAFQAERDMTQRISFNIVVEVRHSAADLGDDVDLILSYDRVTEAIDVELAAERLNLLETLAERVADRILREPQAQRVFVRIEKLDRGGGALGVEIVRSGEGVKTKQEQSVTTLNARVVALGNEALAAPHLSGWVDQLLAMDAPLVVCVPALEPTHLRGMNPVAQAQIDLLEIEQRAWAFASEDSRFAVVGTRTELDWATKNAQPCVWAPSKFVMDAVQSPRALINAPSELANWLAEQIGAIELVMIGEELPKRSNISCRSVPVSRIDL